jgi:hypothetical protein
MSGRTRALVTVAVALAALGATAASAHAVTIVSAMNSTSSSTFQQDGRLFRDGIPSTCGTAKAPPAVTLAGTPLRYRAHTFQSRVTNPLCIDVSVTTACSNLFSASYLGTFDPASPATRYAADAGASNTTMTYSFDVPANAFFSIVVLEADTTACASYTLTASSRGPWAGLSAPTIAGSPSLGSVLTGTNATWVGTPSVQRRWLRCDAAGGSCAAIPGATGATYTVTPADLGRTLRFRNDATDADGTSGSQSAFVEPFIPFEDHPSESLGAGDRVQNGVFVRNSVETRCSLPNAAPTILQPTVSFLFDTFPVRSLLNEPVCLIVRAVPGCGGGVSPAIYNPAFLPASGLATNYAGNAGGDFNAVGSVSSPLPAGGTREATVSRGGAGGDCSAYAVTLGADAPFATARPAIGGTAATGSALTASNGTWSGSPAFSRSWRRCDAAGNACVPIAGATGTRTSAAACARASRPPAGEPSPRTRRHRRSSKTGHRRWGGCGSARATCERR